MIKINHYWSGVIYGSLASIIWAAFPVMTRFGLSRSNFDEWDMTFIRFFLSGLIAIPYFMYKSHKKEIVGVPLKGIVFMVVGLGAPYMYVIALGLKFAPVEQFAVVTPASMIVFSLLLSVLVFKNKILINEYVGIAIILGGVISIGILAFDESNIYSFLLFLLGGAMWAMYTVSSRHFCSSALHATALVSIISLIVYAPLYFYMKSFDIFSFPIEVLMPQLLYQGVFVSLVALYFYSKSVLILGATGGSVFAALVPALATIISALTLYELPKLSSIIGLIVISLGMIITIIKWKNIEIRE